MSLLIKELHKEYCAPKKHITVQVIDTELSSVPEDEEIRKSHDYYVFIVV